MGLNLENQGGLYDATLICAWMLRAPVTSIGSMNTTALPARSAAPRLLVPALLACYLVWGSTYLAIRLALVSLPPFFQMGTRFLVAGALLMAWVRWRGGPWPGATQWRNAVVVGTLMLGGGMGLVASAEQHIG